jgi:hypothetical protein
MEASMDALQREAGTWVKFLKATVAGGLLFLLPLVLVVLLVGHA